jgi:hypothetical protein
VNNDPKELSAAMALAEARVELQLLHRDLDFQKRLTEAWADMISDQVKEATAMRRDLAEAIYLLRVFGFCTEGDPDLELLLVERRQRLLERHP